LLPFIDWARRIRDHQALLLAYGQLAAGPLSLNMPVRRLMKNPQASALLQAVLGDMWQSIVSNPLSQGISLREISGFLQAALPESALNQLDAQLAKIPVE